MLLLLCWLVIGMALIAMIFVRGKTIKHRVNGLLMGLIPVGVVAVGTVLVTGAASSGASGYAVWVMLHATNLGAAVLAVFLYRKVRQARLNDVMAELESGEDLDG